MISVMGFAGNSGTGGLPWQPKNFPVIFRMYQLNLDGKDTRVYKKYWDSYAVHFVEAHLSDS